MAEGSNATLGGLMVADNVLLVLAVLSSSWFAVQQSVDDSRDDENTFTLARAMLTAEQHAANIIQKNRETSASLSSSAVSIARDIPSRGPSIIGYRETASPI